MFNAIHVLEIGRSVCRWMNPMTGVKWDGIMKLGGGPQV